MSTLSEYIESGILEMYVLGATTPEESREVERMATTHPEIRTELNAISLSLEAYALSHALAPEPTLKYLILATIDYTERLKKGEQPTVPPALTPASRIEDYADWLTRPDLQDPEILEGIYVKLIGVGPGVTTAIVWLQEAAPLETHQDEHERFLIVAGTCNITVGEKVNHLVPGNYFEIPLHLPHLVKVTSVEPCKVILQRIAVAACPPS